MKKVLYAIRMNEDTIQDLQAIAKQKKRNTSELIRRILENYIEGQRI